MDLFTYLMAKNDHNTSVNKDLFSYLLGKNQSGTYTDYSGTTISANNTKKAKMKLDLLGNTSQTGTPTPTSPIPISVVSGNNEVVVCGKNLIDNSLFTTGTATLVSYDSDNVVVRYTSIYQAKTQYIDVSTGKYTFSIGNISNTTAKVEVYKYKNGSVVGSVSLVNANGTLTIDNTDNSADQIRITLSNQNLSGTNEITFSHLQLEKSASATPYEPYQSQTYEVDLPVENLFDIQNKTGTRDTNTFVASNQEITVNSNSSGTESSFYLNDVSQVSRYASTYSNALDYNMTSTGGNYILTTYFSYRPTETLQIYLFTNKRSIMKNTKNNDHWDNGTLKISLTLDNDEYIKSVQAYTAATNVFNNLKITAQLEKGTKANHYTPYGTTPIELCKIGTYQDYFTKNSGKNLFDKDTATIGKIVSRTTGLLDTNASYGATDFIPVKAGEQYTFYGFNYWYTAVYDENKDYLSNVENTATITIPNGAYYLRTSFQLVNMDIAQFEKGSQATPYEPYGTGQWCKYNVIGKVVLDGTNIAFDTKSGSTANIMYSTTVISDIKKASSGATLSNIMATHFTSKTPNNMYSNNTTGIGVNTNGTIACGFGLSSTLTTKELANTWLSNNNVTTYYELATPYLSLIEDTNLIEQLDNLQNAMSYEGTTNIGQVNNDLPFNIDAKIKVGN